MHAPPLARLPVAERKAQEQKKQRENKTGTRRKKTPCEAAGPLCPNSGAFLGTLSAAKEYRIADFVIAPKARVYPLKMDKAGTACRFPQCPCNHKKKRASQKRRFCALKEKPGAKKFSTCSVDSTPRFSPFPTRQKTAVWNPHVFHAFSKREENPRSAARRGFAESFNFSAAPTTATVLISVNKPILLKKGEPI